MRWFGKSGTVGPTGRIGAVLIDIDGVLTVSWEPLPGAVEAMERLRAADVPLALVTNTTSRTRARIARRLADAGFPVGPDDIRTAPAVTAAHLREHHPEARCPLISAGDVRDDLPGVDLVEEEDAGGAVPDGLDLDTGAFLLGLERAAGTEAVVTGKPSGAFFATALAHLGAEPAGVLMAGDDIDTDVLAAQGHGITGVLVRTGKYRPETRAAADGTPDHVVDTFADVPALVERLGR
ncbi:HAD hydrolase-like protein [Streptomyces sp. SM10]|uniref:HAD hydrolase-like protein n=1 Tax=Streptomyces sp. SM10 TaxID=565556 RepID=UPI00215600F6|nr:HAD hydrolase-like protein [Streptomyces sp. SM10]